MTLWWFYPGDQDGAPFEIAVTQAVSAKAACVAFGERWPSPCVHELRTPALLAEFASCGAGEVRYARVPRLPSFYDRYRLGAKGYDFAEMARDDIDIL